MNEKPELQIRVNTIDGFTRAFIQDDPEQVNRTLAELHPALIFGQDRLKIVEDDTEVALVCPLITRVDLITRRLSVWDFPFVLGALMEVTEAEFREGLDGLARREPSGEMPVFLGIEMVSGERLFLWMRIVAGLSSARLAKVYSLLKERRLIFGLRRGGIGVLNLSNLLRFSVHPEPPTSPVSGPARYDLDQRRKPAKNHAHSQAGNGESSDSSHNNHAAFDFETQEQKEDAANLERKSL